MKIDTKIFEQKFYVTSINHDMILGLPWLTKYNPLINWREGTLMWDWEWILPKTPNEGEENKEVDPLVISFIQGKRLKKYGSIQLWLNQQPLHRKMKKKND